MKKKVLLAAVAAAFGFSINASADPVTGMECTVCNTAFHYCVLSYDKTKCTYYTNLCDWCVAP